MSITLHLRWAKDADRNLPLPRYATKGSAGADLCANFPPDIRERALTLAPGERALIPTGLHMAIPEGYEVQIRPRSGMALKHGVGLVNAPGTVDSDYRGPVGVILVNHGDDPFDVTHGLRIAQMVVAPVVLPSFELVDDLDETPRGQGGFGSTGADA
jgi:dUTP pyrophosphatase